MSKNSKKRQASNKRLDNKMIDILSRFRIGNGADPLSGIITSKDESRKQKRKDKKNRKLDPV